jgi:hypothetical protein
MDSICSFSTESLKLLTVTSGVIRTSQATLLMYHSNPFFLPWFLEVRVVQLVSRWLSALFHCRGVLPMRSLNMTVANLWQESSWLSKIRGGRRVVKLLRFEMIRKNSIPIHNWNSILKGIWSSKGCMHCFWWSSSSWAPVNCSVLHFQHLSPWEMCTGTDSWMYMRKSMWPSMGPCGSACFTMPQF